MSYQEVLFPFLGGLGIFLFGMKYMGDGLQKSAGDSLREILNTFTSTPLRSVLAGLIVTAIIQSSSGTTVLTVGLVSVGFMSLRQAIGVIMGANVGTTVTAFIIGFNLSSYALPIIGVGSILLFFSKRETINTIGQILFGFGCLFYGLKLMGDGMAPLSDLPQFSELMVNVSHHPVLGVGIGTLLTMVLQSSSATIGILQQLYSQGSLAIGSVLPILFGDNIGTTITAVIAALGVSVAAKRTAAAHVIFNLIGAIIFTTLLTPFTAVVVRISDVFNLQPAMQIAVAHGLFNVSNLLIQFWFIDKIELLVRKIIPGKDKSIDFKPSNLNESIIQSSTTLALNQAKIELLQMGDYVLGAFDATKAYYENQHEIDKENAGQYETAINDIDNRLTEYLVQLSAVELSIAESHEQTMMLELTKDLERIGDHCRNIIQNLTEAIQLEKKQKAKDKKAGKVSERDSLILYDEDVVDLFEKVMKNIRDSLVAFENDDKEMAAHMLDREEQIDQMVKKLRKKYISTMNSGKGRAADGVLFIDIASNLERMSDRTIHIAKYILGERYGTEEIVVDQSVNPVITLQSE
ncbi:MULTISPECIES: Na/Pi cotransporter family protein [unclassified Enterococcus]|uniref:Na/Pi cotransporter family protein n=1 Tax=unclassified Enterococcus TaxID=2608891 RepID=UPI001CE09F7F|nr:MULTISPECIES: Na/Pi cotransporter family protein [unclassified Enterococcus]MCA5011443.1 Na/Pi cotransporter family protein [Enterococcus sp. S23]MCA5015115.1 Na/Pi cotransporter family protein [Enterococcus sp. S22(2020)]